MNERGLFFGEPFAVELTLQVNKPFDALMTGFCLNTIEGQRVMTIDSDADRQTWQLQPGRYVVRIGLPRLPVSPGRYHLSISIGQGRHFADIIDGFALWEVQPGQNDFESDRGFGGCRLTSETSIRPA